MDRVELLMEFILQSDLIEGISDSRAKLEAEIRSGKPDGYVGAILYLEKSADYKNRLLAEQDIKNVQGWITGEQGEKRFDLILPPGAIGNYRVVDAGVPGSPRASVKQIPALMAELISIIRKWQRIAMSVTEVEQISFIADCYYDFENIHPFLDGNGRTGRAIVFYLLKFINRDPFIFTAEEKWERHFPAFQHQERSVMRKYFYEKTGLI